MNIQQQPQKRQLVEEIEDVNQVYENGYTEDTLDDDRDDDVNNINEDDDDDDDVQEDVETNSEDTHDKTQKNNNIEVKILRGHLQSLTSYLISLIVPTKLVFAKLRQYQVKNQLLESNYLDLKSSYMKLKSDVQASYIKESILDGLESKFRESERRRAQISKNNALNPANLLVDHNNVLSEAQSLLQQLTAFQQEQNLNNHVNQQNFYQNHANNDQNNCSLNGECEDDGEVEQHQHSNQENAHFSSQNQIKIPILTDYNQNSQHITNDVLLKVDIKGEKTHYRAHTPKRQKLSKMDDSVGRSQNQPIDGTSPYSFPNTTQSGGVRAARAKVTKSHTCQYCNKEFTRAHHLSRHILLHTGEKPYVCVFDNCTQAYNRKDSLTRHLRQHTKIEQTFNNTVS